MKPRRYDDRVGYFNETFEDYGSPKQEVESVSYITRWRLEKKDPKAAVSEPKKPIVFYIGREVPAKWRPWIKKGIEAWQPAFEKAGFKNAILAKEPPSPREDPDWDAEDARYSTIRWLPSTIENAYGPHVHDPRTGEILESDIRMYHNVLKLVRDWYFVQASPNDPRAQSLPLPDDLIGRAGGLRHDARSRPHARLPAQHEGQLVVHRRAAPRPGVHQEVRRRGVDHGLRPVQLRRPARRRRPVDPDHRPVR